MRQCSHAHRTVSPHSPVLQARGACKGDVVGVTVTNRVACVERGQRSTLRARVSHLAAQQSPWHSSPGHCSRELAHSVSRRPRRPPHSRRRGIHPGQRGSGATRPLYHPHSATHAAVGCVWVTAAAVGRTAGVCVAVCRCIVAVPVQRRGLTLALDGVLSAHKVVSKGQANCYAAPLTQSFEQMLGLQGSVSRLGRAYPHTTLTPLREGEGGSVSFKLLQSLSSSRTGAVKGDRSSISGRCKENRGRNKGS